MIAKQQYPSARCELCIALRVDSEDHYADHYSTGNGASTLALKPIGRVNQSLKQRIPVATKMVTCHRNFSKSIWSFFILKFRQERPRDRSHTAFAITTTICFHATIHISPRQTSKESITNPNTDVQMVSMNEIRGS